MCLNEPKARALSGVRDDIKATCIYVLLTESTEAYTPTTVYIELSQLSAETCHINIHKRLERKDGSRVDEH